MELTLELENFQGPISLLYHLIEKNKIDIYDIPISEITDQYLAIIEEAQSRNLDFISEFLIMAATLLEIKSRMLLPKPKDENEEEIDPRAELVEKLIEYKKFKNVTEKLRELEEASSYTVYKTPDPSLVMFKKDDDIELEDFLNGITIDDIFNAFKDVMNRKELKVDKVRSSFKSVEKDLYTVEEKTSYIRDLLTLSPKINFKDIFREKTKKIEIVVTFMAVLEMIKTKEIAIQQDIAFGNITLIKYKLEGNQ